MKQLFLFLVLISFHQDSYTQRNQKILDSIRVLQSKVEENNNSDDDKIKVSEAIYQLALKTKIDSIILKTGKDLSLVYANAGKFDLYKTKNEENLILATKLKDTSAIATANFNLGWYYYRNDKNYEAYNYYLEALINFELTGNIQYKASCLLNIAHVQKDEKDYLGSEQNAIKALRIFNSLPEDNNTLYDKDSAYTVLGLTSFSLGNYENALIFHNKALNISEKLDDYFGILYSKNNIAMTYRVMGDLDRAKGIYKQLLSEPNLEENDPSFYALILDNDAYTSFISKDYNKEKVENQYKKALSIADSIDHSKTKLIIFKDLANLYLTNNELDSSLVYSNKTYALSKEISANDYLLESMLLLAKLKSGDQSKTYLEEYIKFNDSLLKVERAVQNKYARLKYGTDELEAENEQISKENLYLVILSVGLLLTAILVYLFISQRAKNRKLKLIQVQQKANEDIYNLMLGQQDKVDEARAKEKVRVSKELHDGVLGRLFGTRLSLDSMNFRDGKEAMMTRAHYIGELKTIEEDIRKISHELNTDFVSGTGFMDIVSELIETQTMAYGLKYEFDYTDDISWDLVSNKTKINIYRIIQESMQNIYKHANANKLKISISLEKAVICLRITDDGDGFDTSKSKKGIGLKNMISRVEDIEGIISFTSQSGNGTIVNVNVPYTNQPT
ncbi:tetratricopeptide repeat-containing sensor histidine kinase [Winogradskyella sp. UBA3174]|uniref:tetratricopeptide repeat-containing sensor histidine kinase n=1 Tax=Winogradskyella sp. UBA3174 TaxID=1947785 RepID=UPI0025D229B7|nr:tetratricopeptide repeat-containing sensor histidine kinase [Winogradskyella sp. UBA3174]